MAELNITLDAGKANRLHGPRTDEFNGSEVQGPLEGAKAGRQVFDAVYNPGTLRRYFTTGGASGPLDAGKTVSWEFADHPGAFDMVAPPFQLSMPSTARE